MVPPNPFVICNEEYDHFTRGIWIHPLPLEAQMSWMVFNIVINVIRYFPLFLYYDWHNTKSKLMIAEEVMSNQSNHNLQSLILSVQQRDMKPIDSLHHGIMCKPLLNSQSLQAYSLSIDLKSRKSHIAMHLTTNGLKILFSQHDDFMWYQFLASLPLTLIPFKYPSSQPADSSGFCNKLCVIWFPFFSVKIIFLTGTHLLHSDQIYTGGKLLLFWFKIQLSRRNLQLFLSIAFCF